jgi:hypothetical protein
MMPIAPLLYGFLCKGSTKFSVGRYTLDSVSFVTLIGRKEVILLDVAHKAFLLVSGEMRSPRPGYCVSSSLELP